jgi:hypothetical protein
MSIFFPAKYQVACRAGLKVLSVRYAILAETLDKSSAYWCVRRVARGADGRMAAVAECAWLLAFHIAGVLNEGGCAASALAAAAVLSVRLALGTTGL